ncbi:RNA polymerase sigma factor [Chitinophaga agri]|uniref:Sigma-70 family RNA polymerase sigma factor n=1 Tax=Chitinophaga agri TaxID=2703787 RepID=A0A6B9Z8M7_9BACT|nr:sigma-70 family RNA polymerase sigma factor [Chitinophaga agri]QHS58326.1 sigma-70 family RNA polymerase sigma factor [Chitinophaga agri]
MNIYSTLTDKELTDRLNNRDVHAYEEIYKRYWRIMFEFARKMLQDNEQAKDIVQDTFTTLYCNIGTTDFSKIRIAPYLYTIVKNNVINLSLRNKRSASYLASLKEFVDAGEYITDAQVRENEVLRQIEAEIAKLPRKMRQVFEMSRKAYMSRREIAEATNLSEETVKSQISRAIKVLKSKLGAHSLLFIMALILWLNK